MGMEMSFDDAGGSRRQSSRQDSVRPASALIFTSLCPVPHLVSQSWRYHTSTRYPHDAASFWPCRYRSKGSATEEGTEL
jgi:hypothetical protein